MSFSIKQEELCNYAITGDIFHILRYFRDENNHNAAIISKLSIIAVKYGRLEIYLYLGTLHNSEYNKCIKLASEYGHLNIVEYIISNPELQKTLDDEFIIESMAYAGVNNHRDILRLLKEEFPNLIDATVDYLDDKGVEMYDIKSILRLDITHEANKELFI